MPCMPRLPQKMRYLLAEVQGPKWMIDVVNDGDVDKDDSIDGHD